MNFFIEPWMPHQIQGFFSPQSIGFHTRSKYLTIEPRIPSLRNEFLPSAMDPTIKTSTSPQAHVTRHNTMNPFIEHDFFIEARIFFHHKAINSTIEPGISPQIHGYLHKAMNLFKEHEFLYGKYEFIHRAMDPTIEPRIPSQSHGSHNRIADLTIQPYIPS